MPRLTRAERTVNPRGPEGTAPWPPGLPIPRRVSSILSLRPLPAPHDHSHPFSMLSGPAAEMDVLHETPTVSGFSRGR